MFHAEVWDSGYMNYRPSASNFHCSPANILEGGSSLACSNTVSENFDPHNLADTVARIANMDQGALAEFYDQTSRVVYGIVQRILNNPALAEEITLDVYLQIWRQAGHYDPHRAAPKTWLLMIARSRALDALRSRNREKLEEPLDPAIDIDDGSPSAEKMLSEQGRNHIVRCALDSLVPAQREVIELAFFLGLSHNEIAAKLAQPLGTVKGRIRLGMLRLKERLEPLGSSL